MVFRKPASAAPCTAGRELGPVSPFCLALLSGVGQARGKQKRASRFLIQDPSPVRAAQSHPLGRTASQGHSTTHGTAGSRDADPLASPQAGSLKVWAPTPARPCMWRVLAAVASLPPSCFLLCPAGPSCSPGRAVRRSVEGPVHCAGRAPADRCVPWLRAGSLWFRGVRGDGYPLSRLPLALFKVVAPRPGL